MANKTDIKVSVIGDAAGAVRELRRVSTEMRGMGRGAQAASRDQAGFISKLGGLRSMLVGSGIALALKGAVHATTEWGAGVRSLSRELGVNAKSASDLAYAGHHLGIGTDVLSKSFGIFEKHLAANDKAVKGFGVSMTDSRGHIRPFNAILGETADKFKVMPNGVEKTAAALALFGRGGKDMIPFLNLGSKGLAEMGEEARKFGLELTGENLEAIKNYKLSQRELGAAVKGVQVQIGLGLMPVLSGIAHVASEGVVIFRKIPAPVKQIGAAMIGAAVGAKVLSAATAMLAKTELAELATAGFTAGEKFRYLGLMARGTAARLFGAVLTMQAARTLAQRILGGHGTEQGTQAGEALVANLGLPTEASLNRARERVDELKKIVHDNQYSLLGWHIQSPMKDQQQAAYKAGAEMKVLNEYIDDAANTAGQLATEANAATNAIVGLGMTKTDLESWSKNARSGLNFVSASLSDLAGQAHLTASQVLASFEKQLRSQHDYSRNWQKLVDRHIPASFAQQLADMGDKGAGIVAALATANETKFNKIVADWQRAQGEANHTTRTIAGIGAEISQLPTMKTIKLRVDIATAMAEITRLAKTIRNDLGSYGLSLGDVTGATDPNAPKPKSKPAAPARAGGPRASTTSGDHFHFYGDVYGMDDFERRVGKAVNNSVFKRTRP